MIVKDRAIVLGKTKYGEADLILKLLTSGGEVYSAIAKSALKSKKRFGGGVLEPTHYIFVTLLKRDGEFSEKLSVLNEAQIIDDFRGLKTDYDRLETAFYFVRSVTTVAREGDLHRDIFNLLGHALKAAENSRELGLLRTQFNVKLLHLQGVLPVEARYVPFLRSSIREAEEMAVDRELCRQIGREVEALFENYVNL